MRADAVLIVGGGFLGRALAVRLAASGRPVTVLSPHAEELFWPSGITAVSGRQEEGALMRRLLAGHATVIHAAWGTTPGTSAGRPELEGEAGLRPFLAFLGALQAFPQVRLLFLSSGGTVYGDPAVLPVTEDAPLQPRSCHGAGKAAAELFLRTRRPERTIILRPSNVYGPGQGLRSGFGVIRHLLACAAEGRPFQLWGDGLQVRDYLYIDDFADAVLRLIARPQAYGVFNLGSGVGTSLRELIALVEAQTARAIRIDAQPARDGDVVRIVLDIGRLRRAADWVPATRIEDGIARTRQWLEAGA